MRNLGIEARAAAVVMALAITAAALVVMPQSASASAVTWSNTSSSSFAVGAECADVLFIGARGSGEAFRNAHGALVDEGYGPMVRTVRNGVRAGLAVGTEVRQYALDYAATPIDRLADDLANTARSLAKFAGPTVSEFLASADTGVTRLDDILEDSAARCPNEKWVLAGYSQGALAIHSALINVHDTHQLASAVLIADPARDSANAEAEPSVFHGTTVSGGQGVVTLARSLGVLSLTATLDIYGSLGALPAEVRDKVIEVCNDGDVVCDTTKTMPSTTALMLNPAVWCATFVARAYDVHGHYGTDDASASGISERVLASYGTDAATRVAGPLPVERTTVDRRQLDEQLTSRVARIVLRGREQRL